MEEKKKKTAEFWRYAAYLVVLFLIFIWLVSGLINLQLDKSEEYKEKAETTRTKTIYLRGKRGSISTSDSVVMAEDEPMEREVAIDPEMLGKVFENLLDIQDRKSKGAFYTPREIVHYMCQESLINYLAGKTGIVDEDIRKFILYGEYFRDTDTQKTLYIPGENGGKGKYEFDRNKKLEIPEAIFSFKNNTNRLQELDTLLENVKIADPAVGSGAFPLGMLNEIVKARQTLTAYMALDMDPFRRRTFHSDRSPVHEYKSVA